MTGKQIREWAGVVGFGIFLGGLALIPVLTYLSATKP